VLDPSETVFTITDLVADGALGELSVPQREGILAIRRASRGLTRLARDLSTVAALERGDLRLSQVSVEVGGLMEQAAALLIPVASDRRQMVELSVESGLVHPRLDEALFGRVLEGLALDLVGGAPDATKLVLAARRTGGGIEMVVAGAAREKDTGEIPPDQEMAAVMARLLTEQHGGTFEVRTEDGIEYRIWLPAPVSAAAGESTSEDEGPELREGTGTPSTEGESARTGNDTSQDPARAA
jgi:K+-sensing histidine kinase KdpD